MELRLVDSFLEREIFTPKMLCLRIAHAEFYHSMWSKLTKNEVSEILRYCE